MLDESTIDLYRHTRQAADYINAIYYALYDGKPPWREDRRRDPPNAFYNQCKGLGIEFYYSFPSRLWTRWGQWGIAGSGTSLARDKEQELRRRLTEFFGATVFAAEKVTEMGHYGPIWSLSKVGAVVLPALEKPDVELSYEDANAEWAALQRYTFRECDAVVLDERRPAIVWALAPAGQVELAFPDGGEREWLSAKRVSHALPSPAGD